MTGLASVPAEKIFDARLLPCDGKHGLIFQRWAKVPVGDYFVLLNDHRPEPLRAQFERTLAGCFRWTDGPVAPGAATVRIERLRPDPAGFDAAQQACSVRPATRANPASSDDVLAVVEIDTRAQPADEAAARIIRFARAMKEWTELLAVTATPLAGVRDELAADRFRVTEETLSDGAVRYRVRKPEVT